MMQHKGQGATEYLVLLAVVLIVALVSVALLGFFPGMASDAQITQSQAYWQSASPLAIVETGGVFYMDAWGEDNQFVGMRIRNTGAYPITLSKILGDGQEISLYYDYVAGTSRNLNMLSLGPGEEMCFGNAYLPDTYCQVHSFYFTYKSGNPSANWVLKVASPICTTRSKAMMKVNNFGFEYVETIDNQRITKRQIGAKPLMLKCQ